MTAAPAIIRVSFVTVLKLQNNPYKLTKSVNSKNLYVLDAVCKFS